MKKRTLKNYLATSLSLVVLSGNYLPCLAMMTGEEDSGKPSSEMKRKFSTFDIASLRGKLEKTVTEMAVRVKALPATDNTVIVIGPTRTGKSTLISGLAGDLKIGEKEDGEAMLDGSLAHIKIGHTDISETTIPGAWHDSERNIVYWDSPGLNDSREELFEICNRYALNKILQNSKQVKIVLAIREDQMKKEVGPFLNLLKNITGMFEDNSKIKPGLSLVFTQGTVPTLGKSGFDPKKKVGIFRKQVEENPAMNVDPRVKDLMRFFDANPDRMFYFPKPKENSELGSVHTYDKEGMLAVIGKTSYIAQADLKVSVNLPAEVTHQLSTAINGEISSIFEECAATEMTDFLRSKIEKYQGNIDDLREDLEENHKNLASLRTLESTGVDSVSQFLNKLRPFLKLETMKKLDDLLEQIKYLKEHVDPSVKYEIGSWKGYIESGIGILDYFLKVEAEPKYEEQTKTLKFRPGLVSMGHIERSLILEKREVKTVDIFSGGAIFFDADIEKPGMTFNVYVPHWKVDGAHTINLSGKKGDPFSSSAAIGGDGAPGKPGQSGGHFNGGGKTFTQLGQLTILADGGEGGKGQDGGKGSTGQAGAVGDKTSVLNHTATVIGSGDHKEGAWHEGGPRIYPANASRERGITGRWTSYKAEGSDGLQGGQGGKGGIKGLGGSKGTIQIEGQSTRYKTKDGDAGHDGTVGAGGDGGTAGQDIGGKYIHLLNNCHSGYGEPNIGELYGHVYIRNRTEPSRWESALSLTTRNPGEKGPKGVGVNDAKRKSAPSPISLDIKGAKARFKVYKDTLLKKAPALSDFLKN